jgi:hypothetical protein
MHARCNLQAAADAKATSSSRGSRARKPATKQSGRQSAKAGGASTSAAADATSNPAAEYQATALQWMRSTLRCVLAAGAEGRKLVLHEWRLLDFMEVRAIKLCQPCDLLVVQCSKVIVTVVVAPLAKLPRQATSELQRALQTAALCIVSPHRKGCSRECDLSSTTTIAVKFPILWLVAAHDLKHLAYLLSIPNYHLGQGERH